ncbi:hypothetical protein BKA66DRAFT_489547 [Pyrenochaeta sp. MPI-SDFR-AT-0127]|nr:hypothetical protein BKA66DRAFT_489547 [Pyrenochaeta sp. MPI-SDFR-AT-0127]
MTGDVEVVPKASRTRSRTGCLCCRRRKRKCDGAQPQCWNCRTRGDECRWGPKALFHPSRTLQLSSEESAALLAIEEERSIPGAQPSTIIVNDTAQVVREYLGDHSLHCPTSAPTLDTANKTRVAAARTEGDLDTNIVVHTLTTAQSHVLADIIGPFQSSSPASSRLRWSNEDNTSSVGTFVPPFSLGQAVSRHASPQPELGLPVCEGEQIQLVSAYLRETGTWCETTDSDMNFTISSIHEMMENKAFAAAAMALASRQLDALQNCPRQKTLGLYQHAIQLLIHQDPSQADAAVLATCTLLCVYEMMVSDVVEWRRHLKGCAGLLKLKRWNGSSQGIVNACFWAFARIDVWAAFMIGEETLMPTDHWVDDNVVHSVAATGTIDAYCNLTTLIFAKVANFIAENQKRSDNLTNEALTINALWHELQEWRSHRPKEVLPLLRVKVPRKGPFQTILYSHSSSICGNTFYHAGSILLLQTGNVWLNEMDVELDRYDPVWHAKELGGISTSSVSHANWVNHLQPLYIAGKVFGNGFGRRQSVSSRLADDASTGEEEYPAEKIALLKHLARIERETGWKTSERAVELRRLWGLE